MTLPDDDVDDQDLAGLVAFHRGRAAGHRRAFRDAMDLLQAAAARAADAEAELVELRDEVSALKRRLQNDSQGHRVQLQQLQRQLAAEVEAHEQKKAKVQQLLDENHELRKNAPAEKNAPFECRMRHRDKVAQWFAEEGVHDMRTAVLSAFFQLTGEHLVPLPKVGT